jgi:ammonia channel protein AmtB
MSGAIVGLAVITPCCGFVHLQSSLAIGCISSLVAWPLMHVKSRYLAGRYATEAGIHVRLSVHATNMLADVRRWLMKYVDDSLDVFLCHGVGGTLGAFLLGWFSSKEVNPLGADGILFGGGGALLGWQVRSHCAHHLIHHHVLMSYHPRLSLRAHR